MLYVQLLRFRRLKMCTVDSAPMLRSKYEAAVHSIESKLVDTLLALPQGCQRHGRTPPATQAAVSISERSGAAPPPGQRVASAESQLDRLRAVPGIARELLVVLFHGAVLECPMAHVLRWWLAGCSEMHTCTGQPQHCGLMGLDMKRTTRVSSLGLCRVCGNACVSVRTVKAWCLLLRAKGENK